MKVKMKYEKIKEVMLDQSFLDMVSKTLAERGKEIAQSIYAGEAVSVTVSETSKGKTKIIASGDQVAYMEFGTGTEGEGQYPGKLPKQVIGFISRGQTLITPGWVYNYYKKLYADQSDSVKDWVGMKPKAQMFKMSEKLRQEAGDIVKKLIEKQLGGKPK